MLIEENEIRHFGILRKSGRYPWGSGANEPIPQRNRNFLDWVASLRAQGFSEVQAAESMGLTVTQLRAYKSIASNEQKAADISQAMRLRDKGMSPTAIGKVMNRNESSVRALLDPSQKDRVDVLQSVAAMLEDQVNRNGYIDVGSGVENRIQIGDGVSAKVGISKDKLRTAVTILEEKGYVVHPVQIDTIGTGSGTKTTTKVLCPEGTTYKDVVTNKDKIRQIDKWSEDGGETMLGLLPPISISSSRIGIKYAEEGGDQADGVIYVRPGVKDLHMGGNQYAQVRIAVDGTHYLKGMAIYKDDLPKGVDLQFNTNKSDTGNKLDAMKPMKENNENPFGSVVRQLTVKDAHGKDQLTSAMNLVNDEANWDKWNKSLSAQMLSKQQPKLAKEQLDVTYEKKIRDFEEIMSMTNPTVRKRLLEDFADDVDASAVHLKAAHIPRQRTQVILPINSLRTNEIYAPNFRNGENVVLIRYPHGGRFEIPELKVNNKNKEAVGLLGLATAAVGINSEVAKRLSGADFDGDTVLVIPNDSGKIKTHPALEGLKDFDPVRDYPPVPGTTFKGNTQQLMGSVSNLITDMTIKKAPMSELARAVRHSMVVIDAEKKNLNYKQSAINNGIPQLKEKYQGGKNRGASTLISVKKAEDRIPTRRPRRAKDGGPIDRKTGELKYEPKNETYTRPDGKVIVKKTIVKRLAEVKDAHTLSSGTPMEALYADHSNRLKALANTARKEMVNTKEQSAVPSAKITYAKEVQTLNAKLNTAQSNRPLERQAQLSANAKMNMIKAANPDMDSKEIAKLEGMALTAARARNGAKKIRVVITPSEWDAIQAGAISPHKLSQILHNADMETVKKLAAPKSALLMSSAKKQRAQSMFASGYTQAEVADALGVSLTTLKSSLSDGE